MLDLQGYGQSIIVTGGAVTLSVAVISLIIALCLGLLTAFAKLSNSLVLRLFATLYTTLIRGIPDLVLMLLIFFGGQVLVNSLPDQILALIGAVFGQDAREGAKPWVDWGYIDINPFVAGTLTIGLIFGAYMAETFRGAILAVDHGMLEAAEAYGMTPVQITRRILGPQMMRHALPSLGNNWLVLMKTTALVSIIGLDDMVRKSKIAAGATGDPMTFYGVVALVFLALTSVSIWGLKRLEDYYSPGVGRV